MVPLGLARFWVYLSLPLANRTFVRHVYGILAEGTPCEDFRRLAIRDHGERSLRYLSHGSDGCIYEVQPDPITGPALAKTPSRDFLRRVGYQCAKTLFQKEILVLTTVQQLVVAFEVQERIWIIMDRQPGFPLYELAGFKRYVSDKSSPNRFLGRRVDYPEGPCVQYMQKVISAIQTEYKRITNRFGIVHADLFWKNILFLESKIDTGEDGLKFSITANFIDWGRWRYVFQKPLTLEMGPQHWNIQQWCDPEGQVHIPDDDDVFGGFADYGE